jgi:hypothetical protein
VFRLTKPERNIIESKSFINISRRKSSVFIKESRVVGGGLPNGPTRRCQVLRTEEKPTTLLNTSIPSIYRALECVQTVLCQSCRIDRDSWNGRYSLCSESLSSSLTAPIFGWREECITIIVINELSKCRIQ